MAVRAKSSSKSSAKTSVSTIRVYKSYNFVNKDPIIDEARTVVQDSGLSYDEIQALSDVTANTLKNWFSGPTRRPQFATLNAVGRALGKELKFVDMKRGFRKAR